MDTYAYHELTDEQQATVDALADKAGCDRETAIEAIAKVAGFAETFSPGEGLELLMKYKRHYSPPAEAPGWFDDPAEATAYCERMENPAARVVQTGLRRWVVEMTVD